jgi:type II secretory pathway pseudopilin PulG
MNRQRNGLTLLDVTITMLILGILAAIALPRFSQSYQQLRLDSAAAMLEWELDAVQRWAAGANKSLVIHWVATPPGFFVTDVSATASLRRYTLYDVPSDCKLEHTFGGDSVTVNFRGQPASSGLIRLMSTTGEREIQVNAQTHWRFQY